MHAGESLVSVCDFLGCTELQRDTERQLVQAPDTPVNFIFEDATDVEGSECCGSDAAVRHIPGCSDLQLSSARRLSRVYVLRAQGTVLTPRS